MEPSLPLTGGCLCRRVRYEVRAQPFAVTLCHCNICQTRTGSAFSMSMIVPREGFVLTEGKTVSRDLPGGSGSLSRQNFCDDCLVRTHSEPSAHANVINVRPGTLDDRSWLRPAGQIWTRSARPWALQQGILSCDENPTEPAAMARAFREM